MLPGTRIRPPPEAKYHPVKRGLSSEKTVKETQSRKGVLDTSPKGSVRHFHTGYTEHPDPAGFYAHGRYSSSMAPGSFIEDRPFWQRALIGFGVLLIIALIPIILSSFLHPASAPGQAAIPVHVKILAVNDFHGQLPRPETGRGSCRQCAGTCCLPESGYERKPDRRHVHRTPGRRCRGITAGVRPDAGRARAAVL